MKKEDQYKTMYNELEKYINAHCRTEKHAKVLNCLLESRNKPTVDRPPGLASKKESEWDLANKELDSYSRMTEREKSDFLHRWLLFSRATELSYFFSEDYLIVVQVIEMSVH